MSELDLASALRWRFQKKNEIVTSRPGGQGQDHITIWGMVGSSRGERVTIVCVMSNASVVQYKQRCQGIGLLLCVTSPRVAWLLYLNYFSLFFINYILHRITSNASHGAWRCF